MNDRMRKQLHSSRGMARLTGILLAAVTVLLVVVMIPVVRAYRAEMRRIECVQSLDSATRQVAADYLMRYSGDQTAKDAKSVAAEAMLGWEDICPGYGTVYVVSNNVPEGKDGLPFRLVCGLHDTDLKERVRLNADYVLEQVREAVRVARAKEESAPAQVDAAINGGTQPVLLLDEPNSLRRGTGASIGHKGIEAYYTVDENGAVAWFVYADENHAAVWRTGDGWTGDSYS